MTANTATSQRRVETTLAFHASRIVIDVGFLLVMAAMSLPFVTSDGGNRSSVDADALPTLILLLPIFIITLIPDHTRPIPRPLGWASLVLGLAAFPYAVVKYLDASILATTLDGNIGIGAPLLVFGTFVTLAGIAVGLTRMVMNLPSGGTPGARPAPIASSPRTRGLRPRSADERPAGADAASGPSREEEPAASQTGGRGRPPEPHRDRTQVLPETAPPPEKDEPEQ